MNNTSENINIVTRSALVISLDFRSLLVVQNLELDTINVTLWLDDECIYTTQIVLSWQSLSLQATDEGDNIFLSDHSSVTGTGTGLLIRATKNMGFDI